MENSDNMCLWCKKKLKPLLNDWKKRRFHKTCNVKYIEKNQLDLMLEQLNEKAFYSSLSIN